MSNFSKQQEEKKEIRGKEKVSRETLGKFFYDLAKLIFTAMILVAAVSLIVDAETKGQQWALLVCGIFATYFFAYIGYNILKR